MARNIFMLALCIFGAIGMVSCRCQSAANSSRICAIGDLHGDVDAARRALKLCGAIDAHESWIGKDLVVVQIGDILDRGDTEKEIIALFKKLEQQAKAANGSLHTLLGNHEIMNLAGDLRYVTEAGFAAYRDYKVRIQDNDRLAAYPEDQRGRAAAYLPGGVEAKFFEDKDVVKIIDNTVFVHGGVTPKHVSYGVKQINAVTKQWIAGKRAELPPIMKETDAPVWLREYSTHRDLPMETCAKLKNTLQMLGAKRMVIGHTVQKDGISPACGGLVWRIDVGMAQFYGLKLEVLLIEGDSISVSRESDIRHKY